VSRNAKHLSLINIYGFNVFFEQHLFYSLAKERGIPISFLIKELIEDDKYRHLGDFHEVPCKNNYLHLIGEYKRDEHTCMQMAAKLRELYPEYYYRIISLCKKECNSVTISFYTNKRFLTINDYIQFDEKSKESYSNSSDMQIQKSINKNSGSILQNSEKSVMTLLKRCLSNIAELNTTTKIEAEKDLKKFSEDVRRVLKRNKEIQHEYLYGRDLKSVNWYCELFGNDSGILRKRIAKCKEIEIIKSKFDWGGLLNKIGRVGIEYYEVLELSPGEFYNLLVPEIFGDGFSINDLDEMEKIILEHLSDPISVRDLFVKMHIYVEDDIIKNHLDEYEHLIVVMLK
jgi:Txe/YoeB family toxin of Txe-Axe toxin-antitoxin module